MFRKSFDFTIPFWISFLIRKCLCDLLQSEFACDELHRFILRLQTAFELPIFNRSENSLKGWPRTVARRDEVIARDKRRRAHLLRRSRGQLLFREFVRGENGMAPPANGAGACGGLAEIRVGRE